MERVSKLNRLLEIEEYMIEKNMLSTESKDPSRFYYEFEVPTEFAETVQTYVQQVEDAKQGRETTRSKK